MSGTAYTIGFILAACASTLSCSKDSAPLKTAGSGGKAAEEEGGKELVQCRFELGGAPGAGTDGQTGAAAMPSRPISEWPIDAGTKDGPFEWIGIIGTGQSLHAGCQGPAISTSSAYKNVMLQDQGPDPKYPIDGNPTAQWTLVPLVEPIRYHVPGYADDDYRYPNNICITDGKYGETPTSGFANTLSALWAERGKGDYVTAHSVVARGSACLAQIGKAAASQKTYAAGIAETKVFKALADKAGKKYGVAAVLLTHGECDTQNTGMPNYKDGLVQMWKDYNADIKAITGQDRDIVILASQQSSVPAAADAADAPNVLLWEAGRENPGKIICTGPKYAYGDYGVHFPTGSGYERLGEKYAEVFDYVVNREAPWKPLGPSKATRAGAVITLAMDVPHPPMVWDSHLAPPHKTKHTAWANGNGFEVSDKAGKELTITSTEISGTDIVITLAADPGGPVTVAYAITQDGTGWIGGYKDGMHGTLRDWDDFIGYAKQELEVSATSGSPDISIEMDGFLQRAALDIVTGEGVPADTVVSAVSPTKITLSAPWTGKSGKTQMSFHHNHYNYAVHFSMNLD